MKRIGLTGGMGSGKSAVARIFASYGAIVIDADAVAREIRQPGKPGHDAILKRFQTADRLELRRILATSPEAKRDLEGILHPLIHTESERRIAQAMAANPAGLMLVYEATLLIEAGRATDFDQVVVVTSREVDRIKRVAIRDKISEKDAELIIHTQNPDHFRLPFADHVIENLGTEADLQARVRKVVDQIISA